MVEFLVQKIRIKYRNKTSDSNKVEKNLTLQEATIFIGKLLETNDEIRIVAKREN